MRRAAAFWTDCRRLIPVRYAVVQRIAVIQPTVDESLDRGFGNVLRQVGHMAIWLFIPENGARLREQCEAANAVGVV